MPITSLKFRPGINKETLGGWEKYSLSTFLGTSRSLHAWANLEGNKYLGLGTELKFYIEESQGYNDITPLRRKVVSGVTVFDLGGLTVTCTPSGNVGTGSIGTVTVLGSQDVPVLARNPDTGILSVATGQVGTVTIEIPPTSANLFATGAVGTATVSITNESTVIVGD